MQNSFKDHFKMLVRLSVFSTLATTLLWIGSSLILQLVSLFVSPANSSIFQDVARLPIVTMNVVYHPLTSHFIRDKTSSLTDQIAQRDSVFGSNSASVLAASDTLLNTPSVINFNIDAFFKENILISKDASVEGTFTAPNITYNVRAGTGVTVTGGQNPVISNTGVTSLGGQTGAFTLGSNISLANNTLSASFSGISSLSAGSGVSVSGNEITNSDKGSSQSIFKNIAVSGQTSITADSNNDTLTFVEGSGITITTDATNKKVTITKTSSAGGVTSLNSLVGDLTIAGGGINSVSTLGTTITVTGTEADTLATVTGRGATTATASTFNGGLITTTLSATSIGGYTLTGNITGSGSPILSGLGIINGATLSGGTLTGGTYTNTGLIVTGNYTATVVNTGSFTVSDGTNTIFSLSDGGTTGNISNVGTLGLSGAITGATATNTINGLVINSGTLSGITGYSQTSGTFSAAGNTISLNANSNNNTNINTGTSTGTVTIGGGSATIDIALGSDATGDMYYRNSSGHLTRLAIGSGSQVLSISGSIPSWVTGSGTLCSDCLINDPTSTQIISPTGAATTGLAVRQTTTGSPSADIFYVSDNASSTKYLRVDSTGAVILGAGSSTGVFTVSPASTDPIAISPVAQGSNSYTGTITSADLTAARTWTFPNATGGVCLDTGNCAGTGSNLGGSGSTNYLSKWTGTYALGNSLLYDDGANVGIGTTGPTGKLNILATTEQLRLSFDAGNYSSFTISASGDLTVTPSGGDSTVTGTLTSTGALAGSTLTDGTTTFADTAWTSTSAVAWDLAASTTALNIESDLFDLDSTNSRVGISTNSPATKLDVTGHTISTQADNTIGIANFANTITKNDSNTRTFTGVQIKPTLNAGASNASTTLNILNIDTTNTVTTGITTNLIKASYGGVQAFKVDSSGNIAVTGGYTQTGTTTNTFTGTSTFSNATYSALFTGGNVGIGTTAPGYKLTVDGTISVQNTSANIDSILLRGNTGHCCTGVIEGLNQNGITGVPAIAIKINSSSSLGIGTDENGTAFRFTASGNLGIGTTAPANRLQVPWVSGDSATTAAFGSSSSSNDQVALFGQSYSNAGLYGQSSTSIGVLGYNGDPGGVGYGVKAFGRAATPLYVYSNNNNSYNAVKDMILIGMDSSGGTPTAGIGAGILTKINSSTSASRDASRISTIFTDATDATRTSALTFSTVNSAASLAEVMRIQGNGNVGIGTTGPKGLLSVSSAPTASTQYGLLSIGTGAWDGTGNNFVGSANGTYLAINDIGSFAGNFIDIQQNNNKKFSVDASGRIGVAGAGSSSWSAYINGSVFATTGEFRSTNSTVLNTNTDGYTALKVHDVEGLRVITGGNVGIGTTSPGYKLDILETASARGLNVSNTYATGSTYGAYISKTGAATTNTGLYVSSTGATTNYALESVGRIKAYEGSVGAPGGSWSTFHFAKTDDPVLLLEDVGNGIGAFAQTGATTVVGAQSIMSFKTGIDFTNGPLGSGSEVFRIHSNGYVGIGTTAPATKLDVTGLTLNTDADTTVGAANFTTTLTKNDSNTRTFSGLQIKPTLNTGGSNASTTLDVLNIDTTNTAITGLTTHLIKASYGGSVKFVLDSGGSALFYGSLQIPNGGYLSPYGGASAAGTDLTLGSVFSLSNTSGTLVGVQTGSGAWTPSSGAGKFVAFNVAPTINQSGSASGDYTALQVNATETSALGTNKYLADFQTGGASKMVISSAGSVGIGTTSPNFKFSTVGTQNTSAIGALTNLSSTDGTTTGVLRLNLGTATSGTSSRFVQFYAGSTGDNNGTGVGNIALNNGNVAYNTGAADFAEYVDVAESVSYGDIIGSTSAGNVKATANTAPLGVVSDSAGFVGNAKTDHPTGTQAIVGFVGQIRTKLSTINGAIHKGDAITSSSIAGAGAKATDSGYIIGYALEDYTNPDPTAVSRVMVHVNPTWYDPSLALDENGQVTIKNVVARTSANIDSLASLGARTTFLEDRTSSISAQLIQSVTKLDTHESQIASISASLTQALADIELLTRQQLIATGSGVLGENTASNSATFTNLLVTDNTSLNNVSVLGNINAGILTINGIDTSGGATAASINTVTGPLQLQSTALAPIEFEGAKITMTPDGSIKAEEITVKKLKIDTTDAAAATLGEGTLAAGTTSITINTTAVTANSQIFITAKKKITAPLVVTDKVVGTSFTVETDAAPGTDIPFSWLIVN